MTPSLTRLSAGVLVLLTCTMIGVQAYWSSLHRQGQPTIEGSFQLRRSACEGATLGASAPTAHGQSVNGSQAQVFTGPGVECGQKAVDHLGV